MVAVAGTHGKTTTTSLLTVALQHCGADPSFAIGGDLNETGSNAHDGSGELFVAEADESDGAFLVYSPHAALVTNVEADHLDNYGTEEAYRAAFDTFVDRVSTDGFLVVCADDPGADALGGHGRRAGRTVVRVGEREDADVRAERPALRRRDLDLHRRRRRAAARRGDPADPGPPLRPRRARRAGVRAAARLRLRRPRARARRRSAAPGDGWSSRARSAAYASTTATPTTPTRSRGDLQAARSLAGEGRVVVAFQPHMVSRTRIFGHDMGVALGAADEVVVWTSTSPARTPSPGSAARLVADAVPLGPEHVVFEPSWSATAAPPRRPRAPRRRRADPRRRRRHPARPRGARAARGTRCADDVDACDASRRRRAGRPGAELDQRGPDARRP